jgi:hypothetical protein
MYQILSSSPSYGIDVMSIMAAHYIHAHRIYSLLSHHGPLREQSVVSSSGMDHRENGPVPAWITEGLGQMLAVSHDSSFCLSLVLYSTVLSPAHTRKAKSKECKCSMCPLQSSCQSLTMETLSETANTSSIFTQLISQEDLIAFSHHETFTLCII